MPTTISIFGPGEVKIEYREPLTSAPINAKLAGVVPSGIHRGYQLIPDAAALTVGIAADPTYDDHLAVVETATGYALTLRKTGGSYTESLAAVAGNTVVLAIYGIYTIGSTQVTLRAYTLAEYALLTPPDLLELAVLGTVIVPGAGVIPAANITPDRRVSAWERQPSANILWSPVLRNASFEFSNDNAIDPRAAFFWESAVAVGSAEWIIRSGVGHTGDRAVVLRSTVAGVNPITASLRQYVYTPVALNQTVKVELFYNLLQAAVGGTAQLQVVFLGTTGLPIATLTENLPLTILTVGWQRIVRWFPTPAGAAHVGYVNIQIITMDWGIGPLDVVRFDDIQAWVETLSSSSPFAFEDKSLSALAASEINLGAALAQLSDPQGLLRFLVASPTQGELILERKDQKDETTFETPTRFRNKGVQVLGEGQLTSTHDTVARNTQPYAADNVAVKYTLQTLFSPNSVLANTESLRFYSGGEGELVITINARRLVANWTKDDAALRSYKLVLAGNSLAPNTADRFALYTRDAVAGNWNDAAWTRENFKIDFTSAASFLISAFASISLGGAVTPGTAWNGLAADAENARLQLNPSGLGTRTLIAVFGAAGIRVRLYVTTTQSLELTANAVWQTASSDWARDNIANNSYKLILDSTNGLRLLMVAAGAGAFADASFGTSGDFQFLLTKLFNISDGRVAFTNPTANTNPANTDGLLNTLLAKNIIKSWGSVTLNGTPVITVNEGVNYTVALTAGPPHALIITFVTPMANANYAVAGCTDITLSANPNGFGEIHTANRTVNGFTLSVWGFSGAGANATQLSIINTAIMFIVLAVQ